MLPLWRQNTVRQSVASKLPLASLLQQTRATSLVSVRTRLRTQKKKQPSPDSTNHLSVDDSAESSDHETLHLSVRWEPTCTVSTSSCCNIRYSQVSGNELPSNDDNCICSWERFAYWKWIPEPHFLWLVNLPTCRLGRTIWPLTIYRQYCDILSKPLLENQNSNDNTETKSRASSKAQYRTHHSALTTWLNSDCMTHVTDVHNDKILSNDNEDYESVSPAADVTLFPLPVWGVYRSGGWRMRPDRRGETWFSTGWAETAGNHWVQLPEDHGKLLSVTSAFRTHWFVIFIVRRTVALSLCMISHMSSCKDLPSGHVALSAERCVLYWALLLTRDLDPVLPLLFWSSAEVSWQYITCLATRSNWKWAMLGSVGEFDPAKEDCSICTLPDWAATFKPMLWLKSDMTSFLYYSVPLVTRRQLDRLETRSLASPRVLIDLTYKV